MHQKLVEVPSVELFLLPMRDLILRGLGIGVMAVCQLVGGHAAVFVGSGLAVGGHAAELVGSGLAVAALLEAKVLAGVPRLRGRLHR